MPKTIVTKARQFKTRLLEAEMSKRGVFLTRELRPTDVMVVGFPKSAHTWMSSLIVSLKYGIDPRIADDNLILDLVPDLHQQRWHKRYGDSMCFKSHMMPRRDFKRVIYLIRDGRDVMVSYYHFRQAWGYKGAFRELATEEHPEYGNWLHMSTGG